MKHGTNIFKLWRFMLLDMFPNVMRWFRIKIVDPAAEKFFLKLAKTLVNQRKDSKEEHNDVLSSLIKAADEEPEMMTPNMMFQTILQFFSDGFISYAEVVSGISYMLVAYPEVQEKLQDEMDSVLEGKAHVTEDDVRDMPYLDQVLTEALRLIPLPNTARYCTKEYKLPGTDFTVPKGMKVMIPTAGLHLDPSYWPDPHTFDPDRFLPENRADHPTGAYQPFGLGPRQCIGYNLIKMEAKVMFCYLLRNYRLEATEELPKHFKYDKNSFLKPEGVDKIRIAERC